METRRFYSQTKGRKEMLLYSILDTISVRRFQFASHASAVAKMFNCISCDWPSLKGLSKLRKLISKMEKGEKERDAFANHAAGGPQMCWDLFVRALLKGENGPFH
ncbi:Uncharacterized protein APZ42_019469 [Daphnia magna]|uniref:Uncharacterized protein n=1 Tax=Daphnia magna TaxID=35525 RepID=A0A162CNE7_9CRUS|nr:Uncharacterized protein APZ42_019469 [Daphnia magna]